MRNRIYVYNVISGFQLSSETYASIRRSLTVKQATMCNTLHEVYLILSRLITSYTSQLSTYPIFRKNLMPGIELKASWLAVLLNVS